MSPSKPKDDKRQALHHSASLHSHPDKVTDDLFLQDDFFDPRDLVQVKYEMLRRVRTEGLSIHSAARSFGLSRPTFYHSQTAYERAGILGLRPAKRGPRRAHKLSEEVMAFVLEELAADPSLRPAELAQRIQLRFALTVHPRSVKRALERRQKKTTRRPPTAS